MYGTRDAPADRPEAVETAITELAHMEREDASTSMVTVPQSLPNGVQLAPRYRMLLHYFSHDVLASLSCHPTIHQDLCKGLVPATLHSPQLLSACLALSAAGFLSRGVTEVGGVDIIKVLGHLQTSGLALLRAAVGSGQMNEMLWATCLIWCLTDVFAYRQGVSSWRVHLQGIKAILEGNESYRRRVEDSGVTQSAMRHLYLLYMSLQTLPHIPSTPVLDTLPHREVAPIISSTVSRPKIDGFLGYSEELLHVLKQIERIDSSLEKDPSGSLFEADGLLAKLKAMIVRDTKTIPDVAIHADLSPEEGQDFSLCHLTFQQATLIHLYRRLYRMPSGSPPIQAAVAAIQHMVAQMTQGQPCHTWVAMAMPLFTVGCEAFTEEQKSFVLDKVHQLEVCLGSLHVGIIRQALEDMWQYRADRGDSDGRLCANELLGKTVSDMTF